jgi:hypothetical protein
MIGTNVLIGSINKEEDNGDEPGRPIIKPLESQDLRHVIPWRRRSSLDESMQNAGPAVKAGPA